MRLLVRNDDKLASCHFARSSPYMTLNHQLSAHAILSHVMSLCAHTAKTLWTSLTLAYPILSLLRNRVGRPDRNRYVYCSNATTVWVALNNHVPPSTQTASATSANARITLYLDTAGATSPSPNPPPHLSTYIASRVCVFFSPQLRSRFATLLAHC